MVALTALTFIRLLGAEFVRWDDAFTLHHNPRLNPPSWGNVASYWREWRKGEYGLYMPVTYTVWSGIAAAARVEPPDLSGIALNPWVFHAANLLVHVIGAALVMEILFRLFGDARAAMLGALVFAVHPVQVESVAWASGMKDVLGGTLALAGVVFYLRALTPSPLYAGQRGGESGKRRGTPISGSSQPDAPSPSPQLPTRERGGGANAMLPRVHYALAITFALLAMLAKPSAVVVGAICFVLDVMFLRRGVRQALIAAAPMLLIALPIMIVARIVQTTVTMQPVALWARPFIAADAINVYLAKLLLPLHLTIDYGRRPEVVLERPITFILWIVPLALAAALWRARRREPAAAGLIFLIALSPVLGLATFQFQQFSTVTDHYLYLPMFGVAIACAWIAGRLKGRAAHVAAAAIVLLLAVRSFSQTGYWLSDFALFPHVLEVNPRSFAGHNNFATAYEERASIEQAYAALARENGDPSAAEQHEQNRLRDLRAAAALYQRAIELKSDYSAAIDSRRRVLRALEETLSTTAPAAPAPASGPS